MIKSEIAALLMRECQTRFLQVAEPQQYEGEGPFILALDEVDGKFVFYFFAVADTPEFLADPQALPHSFGVQDFFHTLADCLDLKHIEQTDQYYQLTCRKVVPDEPSCRIVLQSLWQTDPVTASSIILVGPDGVWLSGKAIRDIPVPLS